MGTGGWHPQGTTIPPPVWSHRVLGFAGPLGEVFQPPLLCGGCPEVAPPSPSRSHGDPTGATCPQLPVTAPPGCHRCVLVPPGLKLVGLG